MGKSHNGSDLQPNRADLEEEGYQMYVGEKCQLTGILTVHGMIRIDGVVEGEIHGSSLVQVGKDGKVKASIKAKHIVAQGHVHGDMIAQEQVELLAPATLTGHIEAPVFLLEKGVFVNGTLKMESPS